MNSSHHDATRPKVGLGVLIFNEHHQILLGKRKNAHGASSWGPPGGHLEFGETFEECAIREVQEETGLSVSNPSFLAVTNNIFASDRKHSVSIFMKVELEPAQTATNLEPHQAEEWLWFSLDKLPKYIFLPLQQLLSGKSYPSSVEHTNLSRLLRGC